MVKFSLTHSKILDSIGDSAKELTHDEHLKLIAAELKLHDIEVQEISKYNVVAHTTKEKFHQLFEIAEHELHHFYGEVASVLYHIADHLEHLASDDDEDNEYC